MSKRHKSDINTPIRKVDRSALVIGFGVGLAFSILIGVTAGAMGFGSLYPQINLVAKPFVCPGGKMSHTQQASEVGSATYHTARWYCTDEESGTRNEIDRDHIFLYAGPIYGLVIFAMLLLITYLYWNSSVGPAKNGGPSLW